MKPTSRVVDITDSVTIQRRIAAAQGKTECDGLIENIRYLDVFSSQWRMGSIGFIDGVIVGTESGLKAKRKWNGRGRALVPGFIDSHVHIESSLMAPLTFDREVLRKGTTTAICDPHEIANVQGVSGIEIFLDAAEVAKSDLWIQLSSCVPATHMETNGGGSITASDLLKLRGRSRALGLAEMMNFPGVLNASPDVIEKLVAFGDTLIDGHCPGLSGNALSAYIAAGISSCHESTSAPEATEKIAKGMSVWIREGSVAKDCDALVSILNLATGVSVGFCTDDRNPLDIHEQGHVDYLLRKAIAAGVSPEVVFRSASLTPARHYGLKRVGAIAPGYQADLVMLDDVRSVEVGDVFKRGQLVSEFDSDTQSTDALRKTVKNSVQAVAPADGDLQWPTGAVKVIGVRPGQIVTDHFTSHSLNQPTRAANDLGVHYLSVLARYGTGAKPALGFVQGFGERFRGAIGSSVGHDSHNLIVAAFAKKSMQVAFSALIDLQGGFVVVDESGKLIAKLSLPFGGLMTFETPEQISTALKSLRAASRSVGCELAEPFLQLAFLSLPVIPSLKLTDRGLVDVNRFEIVSLTE